MKNIILGGVAVLFGGSILWGNVTHSAYGLMTLIGVVFVATGVFAITRGVRGRLAAKGSAAAPR